MNDGIALVIEVDAERIQRRLATRYVDERADSLDEALARVDQCPPDWHAAVDRARGQRRGRPARARPPRHRPRRRHRSDVGARRAERLRPQRDVARRGDRAPPRPIRRSTSDGRWRSMAAHVRAMLDLQARGAVTFDYGNNIRAQAEKAGVADAFDIPGFVPEYIRPLFCRGKGPFRWAALSGDPADIAATDRLALEMFSGRRARSAGGSASPPSASRSRGCRRASSGSATASARASAWRSTIWSVAGSSRRRSSSDAITWTPDRSPRPNRETEGMRDGSDAIADWPDPERAAQHLVRRDVGLGPSRRRRRHRLLAARRHGRRRRRHARSGREVATRAHLRSWHRRRHGTRTPGIRTPSPPRARAASTCRCFQPNRSGEPGR